MQTVRSRTHFENAGAPPFASAPATAPGLGSRRALAGQPRLERGRAARVSGSGSSPGWRPFLLLLGVVLPLVSCRTAPPTRAADGPTRIALISDLHVMLVATNNQQRLYPLRLARTVEAVNAAQVDLVLATGDLTEHGTEAAFAEFRRRVSGLKAPLLVVPGNHDIGNKRIPGANKDVANFGRLRRYELNFGRSFFVREIAGVRIVGVNSCILGTRLSREKQMWNFLEEQLAEPSKTPTLLMMHHPPFLKDIDEPGGDYFNLEPYPRARLLGLARQGGVAAILSGHIHRGLTNRVQNTVLLTTPPVAFGLQKGKPMEGWTLLTVAGTNLTWEIKPLPKITLPTATNQANQSVGQSGKSHLPGVWDR
jgi:predicted MPP superfamily phosphohydrolase